MKQLRGFKESAEISCRRKNAFRCQLASMDSKRGYVLKVVAVKLPERQVAGLDELVERRMYQS